ncbi:Rv1733c family protein [Amycolatopsis jejuensis]|uniref:Rv1733c family protein n=1 Tax=Amycolatopsis jejuensis TaxID=330084 RepID=UPI00068CB0D2|nr:hypothetical protein [Amycolatopsis jejuensis]
MTVSASPRRAAGRMRLTWAFRRNPLARRTDRLHGIAGLVCVLLVVLAVPAAVLVAFRMPGSSAPATPPDVVKTTAVVTGSAQSVPVMMTPGMAMPVTTVLVEARWTAADGTRHSGPIQVPAGTNAGAAQSISITGTGEYLSEVPGQARAAALPVAAFVGMLGSVMLVCGLAYLGIVALLERRRAAAWDRAWTALNRRT